MDLLRRKPVRMAKALRAFPLGKWLHWSMHPGSVGPLLFAVAFRIFMIICSDTTGRLAVGTRTRNTLCSFTDDASYLYMHTLTA